MRLLQKISFLIAFLTASLGSYALRIAESPKDSTTSELRMAAPDTLIDLNRQLGGLKDVVAGKGEVIPEAIEVLPNGLILLKSEGLLNSDVYNFELKATANNQEVYIINVKITRKNGKLLLTTVCDRIDMATGFRAEGKIYIVVAVSLVLFTVMITYLVRMDRKLRSLNARLENKPSN